MGLDENLPSKVNMYFRNEKLTTAAFYFRQSKEVKHDASVYLSQYGSDAMPSYTIRHADPMTLAAKNRYAAALYDSYNPGVLFGEVLLIPEWTQPTLSQEEIRKNGGIPPPPQPVLPNEFVVQLYNPDQQIVVHHRPSTWHSTQSWDFEMPIQTFRQPSISSLDRIQSDPTVAEATPTIDFRWKRDGKISKDLICNLSGKSRKPDGGKRKQKEPDIPMAFFKNLQEMSVYEPNLSRIDLEDPKGFEVALLLSAAVIKDVYFTPVKEAFNIGEAPRPRGNSNPRHVRGSPSDNALFASQVPPSLSPANGQLSQRPQRPSLSLQTPNTTAASSSRPPPTDPRSQWEIDAETARLRKQVEEEERERKRREKEELKNVRKMVEEEERVARRRNAEIEKETERLRKEYDAEQRRLAKSGMRQPNIPPRHSAPPSAQQQQQYMPSYGGNLNGSYLQNPAATSSSGFLNPVPNPQRVKPKRSSFFGLRGGGAGEENKLMKKSSAIF